MSLESRFLVELNSVFQTPEPRYLRANTSRFLESGATWSLRKLRGASLILLIKLSANKFEHGRYQERYAQFLAFNALLSFQFQNSSVEFMSLC